MCKGYLNLVIPPHPQWGFRLVSSPQFIPESICDVPDSSLHLPQPPGSFSLDGFETNPRGSIPFLMLRYVTEQCCPSQLTLVLCSLCPLKLPALGDDVRGAFTPPSGCSESGWSHTLYIFPVPASSHDLGRGGGVSVCPSSIHQRLGARNFLSLCHDCNEDSQGDTEVES